MYVCMYVYKLRRLTGLMSPPAVLPAAVRTTSRCKPGLRCRVAGLEDDGFYAV